MISDRMCVILAGIFMMLEGVGDSGSDGYDWGSDLGDVFGFR